ncbi:MAG: elongation factor G [Planctomycetes bacterium]|nr:elongation factor G [Planctomycetota bacterium]
MTLDRIRNFGIIAHIDAGKTTTTERVLFYTRRIHRVGNVDEGTTTTDWYPEEVRRGITIFSAAVTCEWRGMMLNLIDTPGHVDFTAEVERSLRVLDGAVVVFDAVSGVEAQSETVWRQAERYGVPRMAFINKMDRVGADFAKSLESIRRKLRADPVIVTMPVGAESAFHAVVDVLKMKMLAFDGEFGEEVAERDVPDELLQEARLYRQHTIEAAADFDDELMAKVLEGQEPAEAEVRRALRKATLANRLVPTFAGSSLHNIGVQPILDAVVDLFPSPLDRPVVEGVRPDRDQKLRFDARRDTHLVAFAFKTSTDQHGELTYARVYTGTLRVGESVYNSRAGQMERATRIFRMFAKDRTESLDRAGPGEIVALIGLRHTVTGDTLCDRKDPVLLERMRFPEPVLSVAVEPKSSADKDKLDEVLRRLSKDDPTFRASTDAATGQTMIQCMGELHSEIILYRITTDFKVPATLREPRVAYKEAILAPATAEERTVVKAGERTIFGHVVLALQPDRTGVAPKFTVALDGETEKAIRRYIPAIKEGALSAAESGSIAGYPLIYLEARLVGGSVTPESAEAAYSAAALNAFRKALAKTKSTILEPHMRFDINVPEEYAGAILNDLNKRGAVIDEMLSAPGLKILRGNVALSKMFGYETARRSLTQGRGSFTMEPFEYRPVPEHELKQRFGGLLA